MKCSYVNRNEGTKVKPLICKHNEFELEGFISDSAQLRCSHRCPICNAPLHENGQAATSLRHIPFGSTYTKVTVLRDRLRCSNPSCEYSHTVDIPFKADKHLIIESLREFVEIELSKGKTLKAVAESTGLHKGVVKK